MEEDDDMLDIEFEIPEGYESIDPEDYQEDDGNNDCDGGGCTI